MSDPELSLQVPHLLDLVLASNAPSDYCLRSLKSVGASNDGYKLSDPELKDRHAGWKNACTKRRYTKRSHAEMLEVTKSMGI